MTAQEKLASAWGGGLELLTRRLADDVEGLGVSRDFARPERFELPTLRFEA
jgi:hypothetical protein